MVAIALRSFWTRSKRSARIAVLVAVVAFALKVWHRRARRLSWDGAALIDPTFGRTIPGMVYAPHGDEMAASWEVFLDALHIPKDSPLRSHIRQLFARPDIDEQLQRLYVELVGSGPRASSAHVAALSKGLSGSIRCFAAEPKRSESVPLAQCTEEDRLWIIEGFDRVYSKERPLIGDNFPGCIKLMVVRRILRTLIFCFGLENLEEGISSPLVIDVTIDVGSGEVFRIHTVAPKCCSSLDSGGHSLAVIQESLDDSVLMSSILSLRDEGSTLSLRDEQELSRVDIAFLDATTRAAS